ncbi:cell envelope integrity protein CreD [Carboxylicivirga sp. A043]|uniref:cell envelope integrity protein CreD n=1 Tax=Carboxylicivirga litoralis TaxID=2816963 RepID=UPI0021CB7314|nr:cell envelope integrity protein CreD [Carboxylicivirga sp. A043]MCU4154883.1 cell envelope integrity protein CreD [Carboxylicivirga sp. A043]
MELITKQKNEENWYQTLTFKVVMIGILVLLLLIPLGMVKSVIRERQATEAEVERELFEKWGGEQVVTGPVLHVPTFYYVKEDDELKKHKRWLHVMPEDLMINGAVEPEVRYRGIYKKVLYNSDFVISGEFKKLDEIEVVADEIDWNNAYVTVGISDNRGIKGELLFDWNGNEAEPEAGMVIQDLNSSGVSIKVAIAEEQLSEKLPFEATFRLSGAKGLWFNPVGKTTKVQINSSWNNPSFVGDFSPIDPIVNEEGFEANWTVTHLNRNFPQYWLGRGYQIDTHQLGVNLYDPVNHYQKSLRSAKYGILIISLTLLVFLFIELVKKKEVQIIQYLLVGLALVLFFSILTALSEHIGFTWAYLVASLAIIAMVTSYSYGMIKDRQQAFWIFIMLSILYAFLFVLLQLNDFAFLAGNIGLLLALGAIMKASLKIKTSQSKIKTSV